MDDRMLSTRYMDHPGVISNAVGSSIILFVATHSIGISLVVSMDFGDPGTDIHKVGTMGCHSSRYISTRNVDGVE